MPYFFDTNVIVGYLFYDTDRLGPRSQKRIEDMESNHTGFTTALECFGKDGKSGKSIRIFTEILDELRVIREMLFEQDIIDFRITFDSQKFTRTGKVIQQYLDSGKISEDNKIDEITDVINEFEITYYQRKRYIQNPDVCTWHSKRTDTYSSYSERLHKKIQNNNDIQVLLDAHDVSKTIDNLLIVTDDYTDILQNKNLILTIFPNIRDIIRP